MLGADFILGFVKKDKVKVTDHFGNSERMHKKDKSLGGKSNIKNKKGSEKNEIIEIMFSIPLNFGDKFDKLLDPNGKTIVYLSFGAGQDSFNSRHKVKYIYEVNLSTDKFTDVTKNHKKHGH